MPIIKSAKKRVRVAKKNTIRNVKTKRSLKSAIKAFHAAITSGKNAEKEFATAQSNLDKAGKKNVMHKNKVARKKRQLAAAAKAQGAKVTGSSAKTKKPTAKKPAAKKAAPKKTAAKKPAAKKTTKK